MKKNLFLSIFIFLLFWNTFSFNWNLEWVKIITRSEWLADEKYLFKDYQTYQDIIKNNEELNENIEKYPSKYKNLLEKRAIQKEQEKYMLENWKNEIKADKVVESLNWKKLWWSIAYKYDKTKIIIHHTASLYAKNKTKEDVENFLRWIYYYHAIKKWWWDIGYNFIIDQFWNIYEWRIGWNDVVWAHVTFNNVPSVWIALIWNFQVEKPTNQQIISLINLATALAKKYNIKPYEKKIYHKTYWTYPYMQDVENFSIIGHKDAWHTACPWQNLYNLLPFIRESVYENLNNTKLASYTNQNTYQNQNINQDNDTKVLNFWNKFTLDDTIEFIISWAKLKSCSSSSFKIVYCKDDKIVLWYNKYEKFWKKTINAKWEKINYTINLKPIWIQDIRYLMRQKAEQYLKDNLEKIKTKKITYKIYKDEIKNLIQNYVLVLLYELSFFNYFDITCDNTCVVQTDKTTYYAKSFKVDKINSCIVWIDEKPISTTYVNIKDDKNWLVYFKNYDKKSYDKIGWNNFHGEIIIKKDYIKPIWEAIENKYVVINKVYFEEYLNWIAESSDNMPFEKIKVMALLAKNYMLFYMNKKNIHSSIPEKASYNAIDDPRIFQKYVWAWYEKTSKLWGKVLNEIKNEIILYENYIPILPYFSCSVWFTFSAEEKFWWIDTPYLVNNLDLWKCNTFAWHGVWLSWKWAEFLSKKWFNYKQIIQWYFPWTKIEKY